MFTDGHSSNSLKTLKSKIDITLVFTVCSVVEHNKNKQSVDRYHETTRFRFKCWYGSRRIRLNDDIMDDGLERLTGQSFKNGE